MEVYEKLIVGLRSYASVRLLTQLASLAGTVYVVRHLDSHAFGQYALALVVFNYLALAFDGTLLEALVQQPPPDPALRRAVFSLVITIGLLLAGMAWALSGVIGRAVGDASVAPLIDGMACALALTSFCILPHATLARRMAFPRLAGIAAIQALCVTLSTVTLVALGAGAWALVSGPIVGAAVRALLLNVSSPGLTWPTWRIGTAFGYLGFGGVLLADNVLWRWYTSLDTFLLGRWTGTTSLGFYTLAQQLADLPLEKISTVVNDVSLPAFAELRDRRGETSELLLETIRTHATTGFPLFWGLAAVAPLAVPVIFGNRWDLSVFPLAALAAVAPVRLIGSIETPAMTGIGRPGVLLKAKLVIVPGMTAALIAGCWFGGIRGAALAWVGMFPICYGWAFRYVLRAAGILYREAVAAIRGPLAAAGIMVAVVIGWERAASGLLGAPLSVLLSAIALGASTYCFALWWVDPRSFALAQARLGRVTGLRRPA